MVAKKKASKKKATKKKAATKKTARRPRGRPKKGEEVITDELIAFMVECVGQGFQKHRIKIALQEDLDLGDISERTFNLAMQKVREYLRETWSAPGDELKCDALQFYSEMRSNVKVDPRERIKAQERIDAILGHDARFNQGGQGTAEEWVERVNELRRKMRASVPEEPEED